MDEGGDIRGIIDREIEIETASILLIVGTRHAGLPARRPSLHFNATSHSYETIRLCMCDHVGRVTCVVVVPSPQHGDGK